MTIFGDLSKMAQNEVAIGVLALSSLFAAGCSATIPESEAIDSRTAAVSKGDLASLKVPGIDSIRKQLTLPEESGRIELEANTSYGIEIPFGGKYELINAHRYLSGMFTGGRAVTDDALVFSVPDDDLSNYSVTLESHRYCNRTWKDEDGTYVILLDKSQPHGRIASAIKFSTVGQMRVTEAGTDSPEHVNGEGLVYLRTPDGMLHKVPVLEQYYRFEKHDTPSSIRDINYRIDRVLRAEDLLQDK